jgi:phage replication-related protein YjqB (UPF0714/DUF867 family)
MSERIAKIIDEIRVKFQNVKSEILILKEDNKSLQNQNDIANRQIAALKLQLEESIGKNRLFEHEIENLKLRELNNSSSLKNEEIINGLVKEIDECISLLNK